MKFKIDITYICILIYDGVCMQFIRAKKAVVSNASMWDTLNLLPREAVPRAYQERIKTTPQCESFMHLHLGFDAEVRDGASHVIIIII